MSFSELLQAVKALPREEKQQIVDSLSEELAAKLTDEELAAKHFPPGVRYEIFTPFDSFEAAAALMQLLEAEKQVPK